MIYEMNSMTPQRQALIDLVIEQIMEDVHNYDMNSIEELLTFVDDKYLVGYLSEEKAP